jgi:hypothetical protein
MAELKRPTPQLKNAPLPTSVAQDVGSVPAASLGLSRVPVEVINRFMDDLYTNTVAMSEEEIHQMYESYQYQGFNRLEVFKMLRELASDIRLLSHIILVCSLRGPQQASKVILSNGKTLLQMGIPASGGQGKKVLTCNKISAATADIAAYLMKKVDVPKRMLLDLPGWLQFPTAGSIKLPENYRQQHIEFSKRFSPMIGGAFNEQIYATMMANAYLDPRLHLF